MNEDFTTRLRLQLREAAVREERRGAIARCAARSRSVLAPRLSLAGFAAAVTVALTCIAALWMVFSLRPGPAAPRTPRVIADAALAQALSGGATAGFGSVWLSDSARGDILRVDPRTHRVTKRLHVGAEAAMATGAGSVWALLHPPGPSSGRLLRIEPRTGRILARIPVHRTGGAAFPNGARLVGGSPVWVVGWPAVLEVDPARNRVVRELRAPGGRDTVDAVPRGDELWLTSSDNRTTRFDMRSGRPRGPLPWRPDQTPAMLSGMKEAQYRQLFLPLGTGIVEVGTDWIQRRDPRSGRVLWRSVVGREIHNVAVDRGNVIVEGREGNAPRDRLWVVDGRDGRASRPVEIPELGVVTALSMRGDVWLLTTGGRVVVVAP